MTSLASYLAILAGAAPQEGQKATPANGTGASGLFAALLETTSADGDAAAEIPNPTDPTSVLPTTPDPTGGLGAVPLTAGDAALSEALTNGIDTDGVVEAVILEEPLETDAGAVLAGEQVPPAHITPPTDNPGLETETPAPTPDQVTAGAPAPSPIADVEHTANPPSQGSVQPNNQPGKPPARLLHQQAARNSSASGAQDVPARTPGLETALQHASDNGRTHGLTTALRQHGQPADGGDAQPSQGAPAGDTEVDPVEERPGQTKIDSTLPEKGRGRADFAAQPPRIVQRVVKTGAGQTMIQVQERLSGEIPSISSPPTLTVNVQAPAASPAAATPPAPHVPVGALAVHIAHQANNGAKRFEIRLDPPELGRIEVRMDVSREGQVMTHLVVERAETLDLLLRDAKQLERALQDAGLDTSDKGMKFSLKDQGLAGDGKGFSNDDEPGRYADADDGRDGTSDLSEMPPPRRYIASTGLDIRI